MITLISLYSDISSYPVRILSAYLRNRGLKSRIIFFTDLKIGFPKNRKSWKQQLNGSAVDQLIALCSDSSLIGFSLFTSDYLKAAYLTKCLKEKLNIPIIWGGKHSSATPEECLMYADMVCIGEGEEALAELLEKIEKRENCYKIKNVWFKCNGEIIRNPIRPLTQDLDLISFPDYSLDEHYVHEIETDKIVPLTLEMLKDYTAPAPSTRLLPYETLFSRGCPYSCSYCYSYKKMYGGQKYVRFRSINNLIKELDLIKKILNYVQIIWLLDDNLFMLREEKIKEFCQIYKEKICLPLCFAGHPNDINNEKLSHFIDAGLTVLHIGVQTGSQRIQKLYKRNANNDTILNAVQSINIFKETVMPCYDVIIDNPYETNDDIKDTIKLLLKFPRPYHFSIFSLTFFPGTELFEKAKKDGIFTNEMNFNAYGKHFNLLHFRKKKYLNFIFPLLNFSIPKSIIKLLINKYIVFLLDRPKINSMIFWIAVSVKVVRNKIMTIK